MNINTDTQLVFSKEELISILKKTRCTIIPNDARIEIRNHDLLCISWLTNEVVEPIE